MFAASDRNVHKGNSSSQLSIVRRTDPIPNVGFLSYSASQLSGINFNYRTQQTPFSYFRNWWFKIFNAFSKSAPKTVSNLNTTINHPTDDDQPLFKCWFGVDTLKTDNGIAFYFYYFNHQNWTLQSPAERLILLFDRTHYYVDVSFGLVDFRF